MLTFGPVRIVPTVPSHLPGFWSILRDWPDFWADKGEIKSLDEFKAWWNGRARDSLTGIEVKTGEVVGAAYLSYIEGPYYAVVHIFKRKGYLNPRMVGAIFSEGLPLFFKRHDIEKIVGMYPKRHKAIDKVFKRIGFTKDGVLRHHGKHNGKWEDHTLVSILRGEVI